MCLTLNRVHGTKANVNDPPSSIVVTVYVWAWVLRGCLGGFNERRILLVPTEEIILSIYGCTRSHESSDYLQNINLSLSPRFNRQDLPVNKIGL